MMTARLQSGLLALTRRNDLSIALLLVAIIFMMILPLPLMLVDTLIALNLSASVVLLMVAVYIPTPLSFTAFPAVLLLSTLFRLALSITTTRLILLQADAGDIVSTFGEFVVGGNLVVGLVVFLIITLVQFIVITKGSERVAEVGARFSLDAMPGKQMSIDGDLRAGVISVEQARQRRQAVQKESQLYGAMDGAMKFVKGDAVAGLCIIVVNIIGGISVGVLQNNLDAGEALSLYAVLTIGDGLISQIPALFISITAGIIVTRVTSEDSANLGDDIGSQILGQPNALLVGSAIIGGFAMIPGFPTVIFLMIALLMGALGLTLKSLEARRREAELPAAQAAAQAPSASLDDEDFDLATPLLLDVAESVRDSGALPTEPLNAELAQIRKALFLDLGVPFPGVHVRFSRAQSDAGYTIYLQEVPVAKGQLKPGSVLVCDNLEQLEMLSVPHQEGADSLPNLAATRWVDDEHLPSLREAGVTALDASKILAYHLAFVLRKYAEDFVGIQECKHLLGQMDQQFPELVAEALKVVPIQKMTDILKRLVSEDVSIRDLRTVLEALVEWGQKEKDPVLLAEYVRSGLKRQISYRYSSGQNMLPAFLLDPGAEEAIRKGIRQTPSGSYLALEPAISRRFVDNIKGAVGELGGRAGKPILLTSMDIRRYVRKLIELDLYELPVLSYQELTKEITIQPLSRIGLEGG